MRIKRPIIAVVASAALLSGSIAFAEDATKDTKSIKHAEHKGVHWSYCPGARGPGNWGDLSLGFAFCKTGKEQSPINIEVSQTKNSPRSLEIQYQQDSGPFEITNNGHTVVTINDAKNRITLDGKHYQLWQFHFHTPSEHTINGEPASMEMHLVHQSPDKKGLTVIGVMINEGQENATLKKIWDNFPEELSQKVKVSDNPFDITALLPEEKDFYSYEGSLTTPPCIESVHWLIMKDPIEFSNEQIARFRKAIGHNNRPVQPLNGREILAN